MIKAIVFDKDGTLTNFDATWLPGIHTITEYFSGEDLALKEQLMIAGGWDPVKNTIQSGSILGAGDTEDLLDCYLDIVPSLKNYRSSLRKKVIQTLSTSGVDGVVLATDLHDLFDELKLRDIQISIATMDNEIAAHMLLDKFDLSNYVSFVAGADSGYGVKPGPGMVQAFLSQQNLQPHEVVVVGDNTHDTDMGKAANVAFTIGVLTGNSNQDDLDGHADFILPHVGHLPNFLDNLEAEIHLQKARPS